MRLLNYFFLSNLKYYVLREYFFFFLFTASFKFKIGLFRDLFRLAVSNDRVFSCKIGNTSIKDHKSAVRMFNEALKKETSISKDGAAKALSHPIIVHFKSLNALIHREWTFAKPRNIFFGLAPDTFDNSSAEIIPLDRFILGSRFSDRLPAALVRFSGFFSWYHFHFIEIIIAFYFPARSMTGLILPESRPTQEWCITPPPSLPSARKWALKMSWRRTGVISEPSTRFEWRSQKTK